MDNHSSSPGDRLTPIGVHVGSGATSGAHRLPRILVIIGSTQQGRSGEQVARWLMSRLSNRS